MTAIVGLLCLAILGCLAFRLVPFALMGLAILYIISTQGFIALLVILAIAFLTTK